MNIIFGIAGADRASVMTAAAAHVQASFAQAVRTVDGTPTLAMASGDSVIAGSASNGELSLMFLGTFFASCESWAGKGNPIDDADATARWLLARYEAMGEEFLDGLAGQYALVVRDGTQDRWLIASDPFGGRNFFLAERAEGVSFSTNLGLLAAMDGDALAIDRSYEDFFLTYGFYPKGRTVYAGMTVQPAGEMLLIANGARTTRAIAALGTGVDPALRAQAVASEEEAVTALHSEFLSAMRDMLPSDRQTVGVLLGGFDSALVAAAIHQLGYPVETYSFRYAEGQYNQPHTDTLAAHLGIRHHWIDIDRDLIEQGLDRFPMLFNQPTNWPNYVIQTLHVVERMKADGIRYCYSGDGCDAAFLGYPGTYRRTRIVGAFPHLPGGVRNMLLSMVARPSFERQLGHPYRVAMGLLRGTAHPVEARDYLSFRIMDELTIGQLKKGADVADLSALVAELSAPHAALPSMRRAYLGKAAVSPNRSKMIASADATGVAILAPYMHPALKRFALALPVEMMRPSDPGKSGVSGKYILSKMAEDTGLLPADIIYQPKMAAVDAPVDSWYAGPMRTAMQRIYADLPFVADTAYLDRLLDEKWAERMFRTHVMTDKVISHAASLLATYARFASVPKNAGAVTQDDRAAA